jgi:hypothetical protein
MGESKEGMQYYIEAKSHRDLGLEGGSQGNGMSSQVFPIPQI